MQIKDARMQNFQLSWTNLSQDISQVTNQTKCLTDFPGWESKKEEVKADEAETLQLDLKYIQQRTTQYIFHFNQLIHTTINLFLKHVTDCIIIL